ncbi:MAG: hypothetical protein MJ106_07080, partial [Lentisphaeria bacterium]|nr:hypothetical protein [Lentisphaeria bacterium]
MKSMTGYGRGIATCECGTMTVEVSAVNSRKQVDLRCSVPRELGNLEQQIRQCVQKKLSRGSLYVAVSYQLNPETSAADHRLDEQAFLAVAKELAALSEKAGLAAPTVSDVVAVPGV